MIRTKPWTRVGNIVELKLAPERLAQKVFKEYGFERKMPVPFEDLCGKHGIVVRQAHFEDEDISGMIRRGNDGRAAIYVNEKHALTRQRFTTAHELGHFLMHLSPERAH